MASIGHIAVAAVAAAWVPLSPPISPVERGPRLKLWLVWSAVALLPDLDAIGFMAGVPYAASWGHRGATHSLVIALLVSLCLWPLYARLRVAAWPFFAITLMVAVSHGLLDAATSGGLGVALAWPVSNVRYFFPRSLRVIPVAPIGLGLLTRHGVRVLAKETLLLLPLWLLALVGALRRR